MTKSNKKFDFTKRDDLKEVFGWKDPEKSAEELSELSDQLKAMSDEEYYRLTREEGFIRER